MTDTEINIAIAEAVGERGKHVPFWVGTGNHDDYPKAYCSQCGLKTDGSIERREHELKSSPKDYCHDLNAMREVFIDLLRKDRMAYAMAHKQIEKIVAMGNMDDETSHATADATARQRAEAFLRVKGLWK